MTVSTLSTRHQVVKRRALESLRAVVILAGALGCSGASDDSSLRLTLAVNQSPPSAPEARSAAALVGVGSCTASGCHGAGATETIVGSEYNIWISQDPHANAYSVLHEPQSFRMLRLLDGKAPDEAVEPYADQRCLACHSTSESGDAVAAPHLVGDGVGCEACHGPAKNWLADHFRRRLEPGAPAVDAAWRRRHGMWETDDLATRIQICARCHVGGEGRDVNHDLIAAGHPRLQFSYSAFFHKLPVHWDAADDRRVWGESLDAMEWALGQAASARAALDRLAERAAGDGPWPELSEWSCADCHHDLRDDQRRQRRLAARGGLSGLNFTQDIWHHRMMRQYLSAIDSAWGIDAPLAGAIQQSSAELGVMVEDMGSDRAAVAHKAAEVRARLDRWISKLKGARPTAEANERLFRDLVQAHRRKDDVATWPEAALAYDALASLHQSRIEAGRQSGGQLTKSDPKVAQILGRLFESLARTREGAGEPYDAQAAADHIGQIAALLSAEGSSQ